MTHSHLLIHVLVRWMEFTALVGVVGGLVYWQFVATAVSTDLTAGSRLSFRRGILTAVLLLGAVDLTDMVFRSLMISGKSIGQVWPFIPTVLFKTHFGSVWMGRFGLIAALAVFLLWKRTKSVLTGAERIILVGIAFGLCLTLSLSGHAADLGNLRPTVLSDWIHVVAISSWLGGLFSMRLHLPGVVNGLEEKDQSRCLGIEIEQFGRVAMTSVVALMAGGLYNTYAHVYSPSLLAGTSYGKILVVKWMLVLPMLGLGGLSRYGILPLLKNPEERTGRGILARIGTRVIRTLSGSTEPVELKKWFFRMILVESLLGLAVLACTAWMTQLPPPHQPSPGFMSHQHKM